jgi:hypothetical protein
MMDADDCVTREWGYTGTANWMMALYVVGACVCDFTLWKQTEESEKQSA